MNQSVLDRYHRLPSFVPETFSDLEPPSSATSFTRMIERAEETCIVQLGRAGDIVNILPIAKLISDRTGKKTHVMCCEDYAPILDGVSYAVADRWTGHWMDVNLATAHAESKFKTVLVSQVVGNNHHVEKLTDSYAKESWRMCGYLDQWGKLPLVFDRRDYHVEKVAREKHMLRDKPCILLSLDGQSSPLPLARALKRSIEAKWSDEFTVIDINTAARTPYCHKLYFTLGLMDRAALLITADTSTLHLAAASDVPVIAFISDLESSWDGTEPRCNTVLRLKYSEVPARFGSVHAAIDEVRAACATASAATRVAWRPGTDRGGHCGRIVRFYRDAILPRRSKPSSVNLEKMRICAGGPGIGDAVVLSSLPDKALAAGKTVTIHASNPLFGTLSSFIPNYAPRPGLNDVSACDLLYSLDLGNGHYVQRLQRYCGLQPDLKPHGYLSVPAPLKTKNRCVVHFEPSHRVAWQAEHVHPRARQVYPESMQILKQFMLSKQINFGWDFVEVGNTFSGLPARDFTKKALDETLRLMASAEWFIGIISGPYHMATALGLKVICIVNFPEAHSIYLPTLALIDQVESEWFYPQNVHLHQEGEGPLVPRLSYDSLCRAVDGEVYPYWSDSYLDLINEKL